VSAMEPWTWEEIAEFSTKEKEAFVEEYGPRGMAAIMAAGHPPRTWKSCAFHGFRASVSCVRCPLDGSGPWRKGLHGDTCSSRAMEVYTLMVAEHGRLPEDR
jgi:hypothetical protein